MNRKQRRKRQTYYKKQNISTHCDFTDFDSAVAEEIVALEKLGKLTEMQLLFDRVAWKLSDYMYCFALSTLWVRHTGNTDLDIWIKHFSSDRAQNKKLLMKPRELDVFALMPAEIKAYRAHRPGETRWIAYTISYDKAMSFAWYRKAEVISEVRVSKKDVVAFFNRRGEHEIIIPDMNKVKLVKQFKPIYEENILTANNESKLS